MVHSDFDIDGFIEAGEALTLTLDVLNIGRAATAAGIPHVIIEMNPESVRQEKARGKPIFYGDATQETVLHHAGIAEARVVVVAISDVMSKAVMMGAGKMPPPTMKAECRSGRQQNEQGDQQSS